MRVTDQMNRLIDIPDTPQRIVSLVPSQTELLVYLGLKKNLVGVTKFCVHPKGLKKSTPIIGGTKNFHIEKIKALKPDLIIGNKEENYQEGIEELEKEYPVWMSDIITLDNALEMIKEIGKITNTKENATSLLKEIKSELAKLNKIPQKKVLYFIWKNPYMIAGNRNFINEMLGINGYINLCNSEDFSRYPELSEEQIVALNPEEVFLSSEPFPFKEKHIQEMKKILPKAIIKIVDGELYSWYGSRMLIALKTFTKNGN